MMEIGRMQQSKQPRRPHYIEEWTKTKGWRQADLARELDADKGLVSRWFAGGTPGVDWQEKLAALFSIKPEDLFSAPSERWFREFIRGRTDEEIDHIKRSLEVTFPRKGHNQSSTG
jgi:transcriptional regulator with XRE-family HTH domain